MSLPFVYHADFVAPLPEGHRFPMPKFGKVYETVIRDGIASLDQFHYPTIASKEQLALVHTSEYIDAYLTGSIDAKAMRRIGFPWSPALVTRTCTAVGGTVLTAQLALAHGIACSTAGGTHHAYAGFGSGFCIFNDIAVAARTVQQMGVARQIMVIDLDVHQGDGTAHIFADDPSVFTFSVHCEKNFPFRKQRSDLDVGLAVGTGDDEYLAMLHRYLPALLAEVRPELVFYDAGVDPHREDRLGKLSLTDYGLFRRDRFVLESCLQYGVPVACVVGGGYALNIEQLAQRHSLMHQAASEIYSLYC